MEHLVPGSGEAMQCVGIGFERVSFALGVDHGASSEFEEPIDFASSQVGLDRCEVLAI